MSGQTTNTTNAAGEQVCYDYRDRYRDSGRTDKRKVGDKKKKGWQVAEMWDQHHEIARRLVLGESNVDVAKALDCSAQLVSNVKNSPVVRDKLAIMRAARDAGTIDLSREIQDLAPIALERIREAVESGTVNGKEVSASGILKESNTLLDRQIGKPTQTVHTKNLHAHITLDDIEEIKARALELAESSDQVA